MISGLKTQNKLCLLAFLACFLISLGLPIHRSPGMDSGDGMIGVFALIFGVAGGFAGLEPVWSGFCWFANLTLLLSLLPNRSSNWYKGTSTVSVLLTLLYLGMEKVPLNEGGDMIDADPGLGYYLWVVAIVFRAAAAYAGSSAESDAA